MWIVSGGKEGVAVLVVVRVLAVKKIKEGQERLVWWQECGEKTLE